MKLLKTSFFLFILLVGVYLSYPAFLAFDRQDFQATSLYLGLSLILMCIGLVSLFTLLNPKKAKNAIRYTVEPVVSKPFSVQVAEASDPLVQSDVVESTQIEEMAGTNTQVPEFEVETPMDTVMEPEPKEDPVFLFEDWWVDELGLYTDTRLIGITGRKQQKILRKMPMNSVLVYHVNQKNGAIEIVYEKVVLGIIPEFYQRSILTFIHGIEKITAESVVKKGRDIVQFTIRIRFDEELREKLQKKLQQNDWRH